METGPVSRIMPVTYLLIQVCIFTLLSWFILFFWNRRRIYKMVNEIPGPHAYPLIGNLPYFFGDGKCIFSGMNKLCVDYGKVARLWLGWKPIIVVFNPEDIQVVLNSQHALEKGYVYKVLRSFFGDGLFTASELTWKKHRKLINPLFRQRILNTFMDIYVRNANELRQSLETVANQGEFDIHNKLTHVIMANTMETMMGKPEKKYLAEGELTYYIHKALRNFGKRAFSIKFYDPIFNLTSNGKDLEASRLKTFPKLRKMIEDFEKTFDEKLKLANAEIEKSSNDWRGTPTSGIEHLMKLFKDGKFKESELFNETLLMIVASTDTTAMVMSFMYLVLGLFPDIQEKVYMEVMEVVGPDRQITLADLPKLEYLKRVCKETMRIFPPTPFIMRKATSDIQLQSCKVPKGSEVIIPIYSLHVDPESWPDPYKFDPDRFLVENVKDRHPYSYVPFSAGPRNCIGYRYANMSILTMMATVVQKYKIRTSYKSIEDINLQVIFVLRPCNGFKVSLERRN